jgi:hypothetical protein
MGCEGSGSNGDWIGQLSSWELQSVGGRMFVVDHDPSDEWDVIKGLTEIGGGLLVDLIFFFPFTSSLILRRKL